MDGKTWILIIAICGVLFWLMADTTRAMAECTASEDVCAYSLR